MAPPWILLQREVSFVHEAPARSTRRASKEAAEIARKRREETVKEAADAMVDNLEAMKPDPQLFDPPAISRLSMGQQMDAPHKGRQMDGVHVGLVSSTDKALVLLYAGDYRPGSSSNPLSGCYLVYDASDNSVSAIPQLPDRHSFVGLGRGAAILSIRKGDYMVAELVKANSGFPNAVLFLWQSCSMRQDGQWIRREVRLPKVFSRNYFFQIDMAFTYADSMVCWVDLLKGVLVCNLEEPTKPKFTFVPLPRGCSIDVLPMRRPRTEEFRTMGSVDGAIKFATLHGYNERLSCKQVKLQTWTLSHDLRQWAPCIDLLVSDLWSCFVQRNLPMVTPSFPVLSMDKPAVVYLVLNEIDRVDDLDIFGYVCGVNNICKAQYVIGLDTVNQELVCNTKFKAGMTAEFSHLIATEFTRHLRCSMEGGFEASGAGGEA